MLRSILGVACFDPHFRSALFENSTVAVRTYGVYVGEGDLTALKLMFADKSLLTFFEAINQGICYHPPCGPVPPGVLDIIGAALQDMSFLEELFAHPIIAARERGFVLHYPETYVLTSVVHGAKRDALKKAMTDLGERIMPITEKLAA